jgi:hypothetical protein
VALWFRRNGPAEKIVPRKHIWVVGPARRKEVTEAFGLSFIAFLNGTGVRLVQGGKQTLFVRESSDKAEEGTVRI